MRLPVFTSNSLGCFSVPSLPNGMHVGVQAGRTLPNLRTTWQTSIPLRNAGVISLSGDTLQH